MQGDARQKAERKHGSTSLRLNNVNPYFGTAGKPQGNAKIACSAFVIKHLIYRIMALDSVTARPRSLENIWRSGFVACWLAQNG